MEGGTKGGLGGGGDGAARTTEPTATEAVSIEIPGMAISLSRSPLVITVWICVTVILPMALLLVSST